MYSNVLMRETLCLLFITAAVPKIYSEAVCLNVCAADGAVLMVALGAGHPRFLSLCWFEAQRPWSEQWKSSEQISRTPFKHHMFNEACVGVSVCM